MSAYESLEALGISIPEMTIPVAAFVPFVRTGNLVFVSGHIARRDGKPWIGQLGSTLDTEEGQRAARQVAIDLIGTLQGASRNLDRVSRIVKLMVLVNSAATFTEHHIVADGASQLLQEVFGERGAHARSAFGVAQIPFGSCVEIELVAELA